MHNSDVDQIRGATEVLYRERQWVPWYFWLAGALFSLLVAAQFALNRNALWFFGPLIVVCALAGWFMVWLSRTVVVVERDASGTRWLSVDGANLPHTVVARSIVVPASARRNALGRQLDPAAFLVTHGWVKEHALIVLDDPEDPTPYWLVSSQDPARLLEAFVPAER
ncbi:DUF3093 domain-containing protein [Corynebacterium liangguodongii]|uniref:DUF3093 domain-containing protein n=1 Tax=Corynebacterium liangguodongii TaxID=2079535 RepID=A0A2S0WEI8_9CORY|nr:DUF3093 domain-containing protein [Corynebacterium liangguodongii]AWB84144.1 DUF3093 domain-containing protein [Corynebacterium liangguodongii]PWC00155.1 DUF3093 domain-containing protein [Corynebacterium liangguodongii]